MSPNVLLFILVMKPLLLLLSIFVYSVTADINTIRKNPDSYTTVTNYKNPYKHGYSSFVIERTYPGAPPPEIAADPRYNQPFIGVVAPGELSPQTADEIVRKETRRGPPVGFKYQ